MKQVLIDYERVCVLQWCPHKSVDPQPMMRHIATVLKDVFDYDTPAKIEEGDKPFSMMESNMTISFLLHPGMEGIVHRMLERGGCINAGFV